MHWDLAWLECLDEQELPRGSRQRFMEKIAGSAELHSIPDEGGYIVRRANCIAPEASRVTGARNQGIQ